MMEHEVGLAVTTGDGPVVRCGTEFVSGAELYRPGQDVTRFAMYLAVCSCGGSDGRWFKGGATGPNAKVRRQAAAFARGHQWRPERLAERPVLASWLG